MLVSSQDRYMDLFTFPDLKTGIVLMESTWDYNCFSWALGVVDTWLDSTNHFDGHELQDFLPKFLLSGYKDIEDLSEDKVAFYVGLDCSADYFDAEDEENAPEKEVLHIARRTLVDHKYIWTSKIGAEELISHETLEELEGEFYGSVVKVLSREEYYHDKTV